MFNIQPGQGIGFTGSKQIALGLGTPYDIVIEDVGAGNGSGGNYGGRILPSLADYEKRIKKLLDEERAQLLNEAKEARKRLEKLEIERLLDIKQADIRQKRELELKYLVMSESLLQIEKDLAEIDRRREKIKLEARIMRDDDELMVILYG